MNSPAMLEDVPRDLAQALALLRWVEESCRAVTKRRASRRGLKLDLVHYALKHGIKPTIKVGEEAAAWAYVFIALDLSEPIEHSPAPHADRDAWRRRLVEADKLLRRARRLAV